MNKIKGVLTKTMKKNQFGRDLLKAAGTAILSLGLTAPVANAALDSFEKTVEDALKVGGGQFKFDIRYRFENVHQDEGARKTGNASTVRFRIGYLTPEFYGLKAYAELEATQDIGENHYGTGPRGKNNEYEVVADPVGAELNQGWLSYTGISGTEIKVGRQRIKLDNDRFIGNVGWRQNEQTFDSVMITNTAIPHTDFKLGYIWNTRSIFITDQEMKSPFFNISYDGLGGFGKLTGYGYFLDFKDEAGAGFAKSTSTIGARLTGAAPVAEKVTIPYLAEYSYQRAYEDNTRHYWADRYHFEGGLTLVDPVPKIAEITVKGGWERLGADRGAAFQTPLGTNHAFQGWADKFLTTPTTGIRDLYGSATMKLFGIKTMIVYHQFDADFGGADYGSEIDALVAKKFGKHFTLVAKYAYYNAVDFSNDTQKIFFQGIVNF